MSGMNNDNYNQDRYPRDPDDGQTDGVNRENNPVHYDGSSYRWSRRSDADRPQDDRYDVKRPDSGSHYGRRDRYRRQAPGYPPRPDTSWPNRQDQNRSDSYYDNGEPYRYSANSGWQQNQEQKYEWNYQDYSNLDSRPGRNAGQGKKRGLVVFTVCLVAVLAVGLVGITGYSIWSGYNNFVDDETASRAVSSMPESRAEADSGTGSGSAQVELSSKPQINETLPVGGKLTTPQIAALVSPSVVGVSTTAQGSRFYEPLTVGSGIIMSEDGYIITNAHVVASGSNYKVQLHDSTPYDAELIGADASTDLAILKINAEGLTAASFGDSNEIMVGETVVAIGNPSGLELAGSVTQGIVSAINREVKTGNYSFKYIQTDAAINPGNSGGALVNEYGQVIGINSSKIVATGYEGIGFAIPITDAKPILDDIISNGRVTGRVMLGITSEGVVDEVDARQYGVPMGIIVSDVYPESDLYGKDVQRGDILTHIDGERIYSQPDIQAALKNKQVGDSVTVTFYRQITRDRGEEIEHTIRLVENPG